MKEKFLHSRTPSHSGVCGKFGISEGNITGGGQKGDTECILNCNCRKENFPTKGSNLTT